MAALVEGQNFCSIVLPHIMFSKAFALRFYCPLPITAAKDKSKKILAPAFNSQRTNALCLRSRMTGFLAVNIQTDN